MRDVSSTLVDIDAFRRTFESGSFTRAARALGVTPQATSRAVARLEAALGVTLFRRTTRSLAPTEEGRRYHEACARALALLAQAERDLPRGRGVAEGKVRLSVPTTYGHHRLIPWLGAFAERHPRVEVELHVDNHNIDFVRDGHDLAIRMGSPVDQTLVARKLGDFALGVYASGAYLARRGTPRTPRDLRDHACIAFVMPRTGRALPWVFPASVRTSSLPQSGIRAPRPTARSSRSGSARAIHPSPRSSVAQSRYVVAQDVLGVVGLARAGVGLVQTYDFLVDDDVARGTLIEVLATHRGASRPFHLLHPKGVALSGGARALKEFILERESAASGNRRAP